MKTLISDLGNVLLFFSHEKMCEQMATLCQMPSSEMKRILFEEDLGMRLERGTASSQQLHEHLCSYTGRKIDYHALMHAASDIFVPNEEMIPYLQDLKKKKTRLILLSNTSDAHFSFALHHFSFLKLFDAYVLSYVVGAIKPEEKIYQAALDAAQCPPQDCFYIDDVPAYVAAAQSMGIPSHTFTNLRELLNAQKSTQENSTT